MTNNLDSYRKHIALKYNQTTIVKHALEVYLATVTEDYDKKPTKESLKRMLEVEEVLKLFKNNKGT
jgi:hypothetical protein